MARVPPTTPNDTQDEPLNPALKQERDPTYGPDQSGTDPMEKISLQKDEGTAWPIIWASATIICIIITVLLIVL